MLNTNPTVTYKEIPGFPGYRAGSDGSIWSCWRRRTRGIGNGRGHREPIISEYWKRLKGTPQHAGHLAVRLRGRIMRPIHVLILETFVGPCPPGMEARHFPDRNPANNRLINLQWGTRHENAQDRIRHGTQVQGERQHLAKLNPKSVLQIRREYATGKTTLAALGAKHGLAKQNIAQVVKRKTWKHV